MTLKDNVSVARRFQRSVRIDTDLASKDALKGFICPETSLDVLRSMALHISEQKHGAFTWTGPYGSGKSSLVIALSALLSGKRKDRGLAGQIINQEVAETVWTAMPPKHGGWRVVPVVGRRGNPVEIIGDAIESAGLVKKQPKTWDEKTVVEALSTFAEEETHYGGVILFIDEMGKFLEAAALEGNDVYIFQEIAEIASRSNGRLIVVGILHQAFEEYGRRLSREMRDEWTKIQGRFIDLSVNAAGEEQVDLLSRAIEVRGEAPKIAALAKNIVDVIRLQQPNISPCFSQTLEACWPLHPTTACLLGPISKRRFGQNQRSLFGFLNSSEIHGFQDFLGGAKENELYEPHLLWDYLRINIEPAILSSPDGHRWALAVDALDRCEGVGGNEIHILVLKTIALVDLFKERSGLVSNMSLLEASLHSRFSSTQIKAALDQLQKWSFIIYKKYLDAYAIFAGSDFDIEKAVETALYEIREIDFTVLNDLAGLQPILAKRHFHETGTLRWFDVDLSSAIGLHEKIRDYRPNKGTVGQFLLVIPTDNETEDSIRKTCSTAAKQSKAHRAIVGISQRAWSIGDRARELLAVAKIRQESPELNGDSVARREVETRLADLQGVLEVELSRAFDSADWFGEEKLPQSFMFSELNALASDFCDQTFPDAPRLINELVNRHKPSSSAAAAQNILFRRMVTNEALPQLGIEGFSAEKGLYVSLLESTNLHQYNDGRGQFVKPSDKKGASGNLAPLWRATENYLLENHDRSIAMSEIYEIWRQPPFGIRDGIMPVLAIAFILSCQGTLALYREGIYQSTFKEIDTEYLSMDAECIQIRWMDLSENARDLLSGMAELVRELDPTNTLHDLRPIDVARGLISIFDQLEKWTLRTYQLSKNALKLREIFKKANDPNQLIFDDLPEYSDSKNNVVPGKSSKQIVLCVRDGLVELVSAYPGMIQKFYSIMLSELGVPNESNQSLTNLKERAKNIKGITGDFKLDAFAGRLSTFSGSVEEIEGLASLTVGKPLGIWIDADVNKANIEIAMLCQIFNQAEAFAHVQGRQDKRHGMAIVMSVNGRTQSLFKNFNITDGEKSEVKHIVNSLETVISKRSGMSDNVILAALAEVGAHYISDTETTVLEKGDGWEKVHD
jgi:hypothetical protein